LVLEEHETSVSDNTLTALSFMAPELIRRLVFWGGIVPTALRFRG
jgi:hypothetical protein